jgi:hypothetical protein
VDPKIIESPDFFTTQLVTPKRARISECIQDTDEGFEEVVCVAANAKDFEFSDKDASGMKSTKSKKSFADKIKKSLTKPPVKSSTKRIIDQLRAGSKSGTYSSKNLQLNLAKPSKTNISTLTLEQK